MEALYFEAKKAIEAALEFEDKPTLEEMIVQLSDDYQSVIGFQARCMAYGARKNPVPSEVRRLAIYDAARRFLEACKYQPNDVAKRLTKKRSEDAEA